MLVTTESLTNEAEGPVSKKEVIASKEVAVGHPRRLTRVV